ncbi:MAG: L-histidine N(alpha)-methyltransferase [Myxococcales bacterium]
MARGTTARARALALDPAVARDIAAGLTARPKRLPPYLFYDERGSALFEAITRLPEYYLTRTEEGILRAHASEIAERAAGTAWVIELGAGTAGKTRRILDALLAREGSLGYAPIDVSASALAEAAATLARPGLAFRPFVGRHEQGLAALRGLPGRKLALFIGSSLGNYGGREAVALLAAVRAALAPGDLLLLGYDLRKAEALLLPAYDDAAGVTARFNQNLLVHLNRLTGSDFEPEAFDHLALWNARRSRVEMHLIARRACEISLPALSLRVRFRQGERLHTENSYKRTRLAQGKILRAAGFRPEHAFLDARGWFAVELAAPC